MPNKTLTYGRQSISQTDINAVVSALKSDWLTQGPKVAEFEETIAKYVGAKYCVSFANGTAALHIAMLALDLEPGFESITSPLTFVASANCAHYCGGRAVFADIDTTTGLIDPAQIEQKITDKTKVLVPVHYAGQSCDMKAIYKIARKHKLRVIEDAAHAIGSEYLGKKVGSCQYSDLCMFSFHPVKTITTGEGGAVTTNNKQLYERMLMLRTHGITKDQDTFTHKDKKDIGPWSYEMQTLGYNYRLTDIQAALGLSQLKRLDRFVEKRRQIVDTYNQAFASIEGLQTLEEKAYSQAAWHLYPLLIDFEHFNITKQEFFAQMKQSGILPQVHYIPVHQQPYYQNLGWENGDLPKSEAFYNQEVSLPLYYLFTKKDVQYVISTVKKILL